MPPSLVAQMLMANVEDISGSSTPPTIAPIDSRPLQKLLTGVAREMMLHTYGWLSKLWSLFGHPKY